MISRIIASFRKFVTIHREIRRLRRELEQEQDKSRALARELDASRKALGALLKRDDELAGYDLKEICATVEKRVIEWALQEHKGNIAAVARKLGTSRQSLYSKIRAYGLEPDRERDE